MESEFLIRILITVVFGAILGLESETRSWEQIKDEKSVLGGFRTYSILCLTGGIAGLLYAQGEKNLAYISFIAMITLVLAAYVLNVQIKKAFGLTTEIAVIVTFILGFLTTSGLVPIHVVLFILVIMAFFLSQKRGLGYLIHKIPHGEVIDILKFGVVAVVILPLLPDKAFLLKDFFEFLQVNYSNLSSDFMSINVLNPFRIWFVVVVISGLNFVAYLLSKLIGDRKGIVLTALIGGIISSTSTTVAFASKSKASTLTQSRIYAGAALIAHAVSFITVTVLFLIFGNEILNDNFLIILSIFILGIVVGTAIIIKNSNIPNDNFIDIEHNIFTIGPALRFVSIIVIITFLLQLLQLSNSPTLLTVTTGLSGVAGIDAPVVAIAGLFKNGSIALGTASLMFLLANFVNYIFKIFLAFINGSREFAKYLTLGLIITLISYALIFI